MIDKNTKPGSSLQRLEAEILQRHEELGESARIANETCDLERRNELRAYQDGLSEALAMIRKQSTKTKSK